MSDPNLNDAIVPDESVDDELDIVEGVDEVEDEVDAADAAVGEPAEEDAIHIEDDEDEDGDVVEADADTDEDEELVEDDVEAEADAEVEEAEEEAAEPVDPVEALREELRTLPGEWYVIHTYAGYENRVKTNLEQRAVSLNVEDFIFAAEVPQEEVAQIKNGERKTVRQNKLPGYVLVRMDLTNESWGVVRNTPGVTGFVGNAYDPYPLTLDEIVKMLAPEAEEKAARELAEAEGRPASGPQARGPGAGLRGRRLGHRHRRPVRDAAGDDQRDQRRLEEGQGPRRDLRPRDPGRAVVRPDPEELVRHIASVQVRSALGAGLTCSVSRLATMSLIVVRLPGFCRAQRRPKKNEDRGPGMPPKKKKVTGLIKLQINAGAANPAPPVGPALGQHGVNIMEFCKAYNAATESQRGWVIPVEITVYEDRSFTFITKTPPAAKMILKAAGVEKGSGEPHKTKVAKITQAQVREIATTKLPDLNANDLDAASKIIAGTARSMGITVEG